nr:STAS domain-containing protein [Paracoccus saliphilus]
MTSTMVPLSGEMTLAEADALSRTLQDALARGAVGIDATALIGADAAILQLLVSAQHMAARTGQELQVSMDASGAAAALADRLGLDRAFAVSRNEQTHAKGAAR